MKNSLKLEKIRNRIYTVRGLQVMLDRDLAEFYQVKPIRLREQVKRNLKRFPPDFMFRLTSDETDDMVSQNAIPSRQHFGGSLPYVFTEQGVAAISSVLTSDRAIEINISIMRAFVAMRRMIISNSQILERLLKVETRQIQTDTKLNDVLTALEQKELKPKQGIFFDGQIFDAYKFVSDLIRSAEKSITLIDNYIDESVLALFSKRQPDVELRILTSKITKELKLDVEKFNQQFPSAEIVGFKHSHDRFLIIDDKDIYHFGALLKDLGKKWFAFSKMDVGAGDVLGRIKSLLTGH